MHYENHDRRLDEWIPLDQFLLETYQKRGDLETDKPKRRRTSKAAAAAVAATMSSPTTTTTKKSQSGPLAVCTPATSSSPLLQQQEQQEQQQQQQQQRKGFRMTGGNWHASGDPTLAELEKEHEEITRVKNISRIVMGGWEVEAWYFSPFPAEYNVEVLYVCEYCLKYMRLRRTYHRHKAECEHRRPPGREIYRHQEQDDDNDDDDGNNKNNKNNNNNEGNNIVSVFEVDGKQARVYCQNLCLLAKLFLDHKTLYYDVDPFLFYVVCQVDEYGAHIVGYFSKEKVSQEDYNLACILTFPQHQKCGFGKFIISLSYELTKREHKTGSPEKPLSDLGKISYRSYWTHVLLHLLAAEGFSPHMTIKEMSIRTGIKQEDIISTLQSLNMIKCWKGQHVVYVQQDMLDQYTNQNKKKKKKKPFRLCRSEYLQWEPPNSNSNSNHHKSTTTTTKKKNSSQQQQQQHTASSN